MRRPFVPQHDAPGLGGLAFGLAFDQPGDAGGQKRDVTLLPGHDVGQVIDGVGQMRDLFLKACDIIHAHQIAPEAREINPRS